jgi:hypothetical protein
VDLGAGLVCDVNFFFDKDCIEQLLPDGYYPQVIVGSVCQDPSTNVVNQPYKGYMGVTVTCRAKTA